MSELRKYRKREPSVVTAVQLALETEGFTYEKWGGTQTCKAGDWLVNNGGEVYTIDRESFERTYEAVSPGVFRKVAPVWAEAADEDGTIATKEGSTEYCAGDYLVFNDAQRSDGYAVTAENFEAMYEPEDT